MDWSWDTSIFFIFKYQLLSRDGQTLRLLWSDIVLITLTNFLLLSANSLGPNIICLPTPLPKSIRKAVYHMNTMI